MVKGYVSALLDGLNHADGNVRGSASEALGVLMKILGEPAMTKLMPDLDAIKMAKVKEDCEKAVLTGKMPKIQNSAPPPSEAPSKAVRPRGSAAKKVVKPKPKTSVVKKPEPEDLDDIIEDEPVAPPVRKTSSAPARRGAPGRGGARGVGNRPGTSTAASRKKSEDVDTGPLYTSNNLKNQRFKDEQKLKILKWNFTAPRAEFVDQLKDQMTVANFNRTLFTQMYHSDFKQHLKAIESLSKYLDADLEGLVSNLDLILKWVTLRFFETNPAVLLKALEYLNEVFSALADDSYSLHDIEAVSFIPYLVNKVGDAKDQGNIFSPFSIVFNSF